MTFRQIAEECAAIAQRVEQMREDASRLLLLLSSADTAQLFRFSEMTYSLREAARAALQLAQKFDIHEADPKK